MAADVKSSFGGLTPVDELMALVPGPVLLVDLEGRLLAVNPQAATLLGFAHAELEGQLVDAVLAEGAPSLREALRGAANRGPGTEALRPLPLRLRRKDGTALESLANARLFSTGRGPAVALFLEDVGADARARRYLAIQYELTRVLAESPTLATAAPRLVELVARHLGWDVGALWEVDAPGGVVRNVAVWNSPSHPAPTFVRATREMRFVPGVGLPGSVWQTGAPRWIPDVTKEPNFPRAPFAASEGLHGAFGLPLKLPGEVVGVLEFFSGELRQPDAEMEGHLTVLASQLSGFVEQGRREALREHLEAIVRSSDDGIVVTDLEGKLLSFNDAAEEMFAVKREHVVGRSMFDLATPEQAGRARDLLDRLNRGEAVAPYEERQMRRDGRTVDTYVRVWPLRNSAGAVVGAVSAISDVTERRRAQDQVRRSEEMLAQTSRMAHVGSWTWDLESGASAWSDEFWRIVGVEPGTVVPTFESFVGLVAPQDRQRLGERIQALVTKGDPLDLEFSILRPDGSQRTVHGIAAVTFSPEGKLVRAIGALQDLTERRAAENALRHVEERLANVFRASPVPISISTLKGGRIIEANESVLRFHGVPRDRLVGRTIEEINVYRRPEDREQLRKALTEKGALRDYELELRTLSGEVRTVLLSADRIEFAGQPCLLTMFYDITERKAAQEALTQSEARHRIVAETAFDGMVTMDEGGSILFVNPAMERIFGYGRSELEGQPITLLMGADEKGRHQVAFGRYLSTGTRTTNWHSMEMPGRTKDGRTVDLEISFGESDQGGKRLFTGILRDVSERKRAQAELSKQVEELARSNQDLEQFAYVASHDLQAPLRQVMSYMQLLRERHGAQLRGDAIEFLDFSLQGAERMQELIDDLLAFSRAGSTPAPTRLSDAKAAALAAEGDLRLEVEAAGAQVDIGDLPEVWADPAQLRELFQNLLSNAIKFRGKEKPHVTIGCVRDGANWRFVVRDNGIGIDPAYQEKVFEIFQRLHGRSKYPGTGIGLAVCKKIVERLGGRIWFESVPGKGSDFYFTLPTYPRGSSA
jgi:PAS domain S-box-containing protein